MLCILDPPTHRLTVVNAGHIPPLRRSGKTRTVEELGVDDGGLPLGCDLDKTYHQTEITLEPGDAVVVYTDGISEAMNREGQLFGNAAVRRELARGSARAEQLGENLLHAVEHFVHDQVQNDNMSWSASLAIRQGRLPGMASCGVTTQSRMSNLE